MNVVQLIERTRDHIGENATQDFQPEQWTDSRLLRDLNASSDNLWSELVKMDENWGLRRSTLTELGASVVRDGDLWVVTLGVDIYWIKLIEETQGAGKPLPWTHEELDRINAQDPQDYAHIPAGRQWFLGDNRTIYVSSPQASFSLDEVRIWHLQKYPHMVLFHAVSQDPDADQLTTTLRVNAIDDVEEDSKKGEMGQLSVLPGYYKQSYIECVDNGKQDPQGRVFLITDYTEVNYPEFDFTVKQHKVAEQGAIWSIAPQYPESQQELLALMAAQKALGKSGDIAGRTVIEAEVSKKLAEFKQVMERRQIAEPRSVRLIEDRS